MQKTGEVKFYCDKGWTVFPSCWFHISKWKPRSVVPEKGMRVKFTLGNDLDERGPSALSVEMA